MTINLTCTQVGALLSFYLDDRLNDQLKQFVKAHLEVCPTCRAKYEALKGMVASLKQAHEKIAAMEAEEKETAISPQYTEFKTNLSAYVDNELSDEENIKIKKYVIANPKARKELEDLNEFRKKLHAAFEKEKSEIKTDFSKFVMRRVDFQDEIYGQDSFAKVVALFIVLFAICTISAMIIFWV